MDTAERIETAAAAKTLTMRPKRDELPRPAAADRIEEVCDMVNRALGRDDLSVTWGRRSGWTITIYLCSKGMARALDDMELIGGLEYYTPGPAVLGRDPSLLRAAQEAKAALADAGML